MPYNPTTHTIEKNSTTGKWEVGLGDIRAALHSGMKRLNNLVTSQLVNKWAKYKPVEGVNDSLSYDITSGTNYRGAETTGSSVASSQIYSCGMSLVPSSSVSAAVTRAEGRNDWQYTHRPKSAVSEPYHAKRAGDFRGYYHLAKSWMKGITSVSGRDIYAGEGSYSFQLTLDETTSGKELRASDFSVYGNLLSTWKKGLLLVEDVSQRQGYLPTDPQLIFVTSELTLTDTDSSLMNLGGGIGNSRTFNIYGAYLRGNTGTSGARLVSSYTDGIVPMAMNPVEVKLRPAMGIITCQYLTLTRDGHLSYHIIIANHRNDVMTFHKTTALQSSVPQFWQKIRTYATQAAAIADTDGEQGGYIAQIDTTGSLNIADLKCITTGYSEEQVDFEIPVGQSITFEFRSGLTYLTDGIANAHYVKSFSRMRYQASDDSWKTSNMFTQIEEMPEF